MKFQRTSTENPKKLLSYLTFCNVFQQANNLIEHNTVYNLEINQIVWIVGLCIVFFNLDYFLQYAWQMKISWNSEKKQIVQFLGFHSCALSRLYWQIVYKLNVSRSLVI